MISPDHQQHDATVPGSDGSSPEGSPEPPSYYSSSNCRMKEPLGKVSSMAVAPGRAALREASTGRRGGRPAAEDQDKDSTDGLSSSELAGLKSVASASSTWSIVQLTSYYLALKAHGKDCAKIADRVDGKSMSDIQRYNANWQARKRMPMEQWLKEFSPTLAPDVDTDDANPGTCKPITDDGEPMEGIETVDTASKQPERIEASPVIASRASLKRLAPSRETASNADHDLTSRAQKSEQFTSMRVGAEVVICKNRRTGHHDVTGRKAHVQNKRAVVMAEAVWPSTWLSVKIIETGEMIKVRTSNVILATAAKHSPPTPETEGSIPVQQEPQLGSDDGLEIPTGDEGLPTQERSGLADCTTAGMEIETEPETDDAVVPANGHALDRRSVSPSPVPPDQCGVCKESTDLEDVVCDGCDAEYHLHCLTPPVKSVDDLPAGDWFCSKCAVAEAPAKTAPSQVPLPLPPTWEAYTTTDENHGGGQAGQVFYHNMITGKTQWVVPTHVPKDAAAAEPSVTPEQCAVCKGSTELEGVVCDGCDAEYHLQCLTPSVKSVDDLPAGDWFCSKCAVAEVPPKTAHATFQKPHRKASPGTYWDRSIGKCVPIKASKASKAAACKSSESNTGAPTPVDMKLSSSEQAGLESIASTSKTWSLKQLTSYYLALKAHGKDYTKIADRVNGKSREEVVRYTRNWVSRKKGMPMEQWLDEFRTEEEEEQANPDDSSSESSTDEEVTLYKSVVNDTLKKIAADFEITVEDLVFVNKARYPGLTKKSEIWDGTLFIIPEQQDDAEATASIANLDQATTTFMDPGTEALCGVVAFVDVK